jgi:flagella basal body P-ring formation protein FlgA
MKISRTTFLLLAVFLTRGGFATSLIATEPPASSLSQETRTSSTRTLAEAELKDLLTATLQREYIHDLGQLELTLTRPWTALPVPDGDLTLKVVQLPTLGVTTAFIVRFDLFAGENKIGTWQQSVTAHIWGDVWVARTNLRRGEPLVDTDRDRERRDILPLRDAYLGEGVDETAMEIAGNVQAGAPLLNRDLRPRTVVRRGQFAEAVVHDGAMEVSLKVEVLEDGAYGQQVRVRNAVTKREFRGKVENEGTISVSL